MMDSRDNQEQPDAAGTSAAQRDLAAELDQITSHLRQVFGQLCQAEARLAYVIDAARLRVWDYNLQTGSLWRSPGSAGILGLDPDGPWTLDGFLDHVVEEDRAAVQETVSAALAAGEPWTVECRVRRADGENHWVQIRGRSQRNDKGQVVRIIGLEKDVTDERRLAEASRQVSERLALTTTSAGIGIWNYDVASGSLMWDPQMCQLYGLGESQFAGGYDGWKALVHPDDWPRLDRDFQRALEAEQECRADFRAIWPDGTVRALQLFAVVQRGSAGQAERLLGTTWDISAAKAVEQTLRCSITDLEQFAFAASHDLVEPLRKIHYFTALLSEEIGPSLSSEGAGCMRKIQNSAQRMRDMIDGLLKYAGVSTKKLSLRAVDLNAVVRHAVAASTGAASAVGARIDVEPLPLVHADASLLRLLFFQLLDNALKFKRPGVAPVIRIYPLPPPPGFAECGIAVEDNGIGFAQEDARQIFDGFRRLHAHLGYDGAGIGLALCRRIVERCGGTISARSQPGQGTAFIVNLPPGRRRQPGGRPHV